MRLLIAVLIVAAVPPAAAAQRLKVSEDRRFLVKAWWFNPRDGGATPIGEFPNSGEREFAPPGAGEFLDWVLVLDDASKGYPPPGSASPTRGRRLRQGRARARRRERGRPDVSPASLDPASSSGASRADRSHRRR